MARVAVALERRESCWSAVVSIYIVHSRNTHSEYTPCLACENEAGGGEALSLSNDTLCLDASFPKLPSDNAVCWPGRICASSAVTVGGVAFEEKKEGSECVPMRGELLRDDRPVRPSSCRGNAPSLSELVSFEVALPCHSANTKPR